MKFIKFLKHDYPGCLSRLVHGKSSMIMDFSAYYFDFHGKSWMAHGRAWPHGSSSMILTHDSSMMSHVENFVRSRKFSLTVSVFVFVSFSKPQNLRVTLMARVALRTLFGTAFPEAAEIGRSFVSIRWVFDGFGDGF